MELVRVIWLFVLVAASVYTGSKACDTERLHLALHGLVLALIWLLLIDLCDTHGSTLQAWCAILVDL